MRWNDLIGRQLGQYTLLEEIGRGGSSRVYRGHDGAAERDVAVKVIPNDAEDRVGFVHRFEREVQAVAQLNHPNIVTVFDRGETDDLVYLVMQCVMGGTLRTKLGKPLPAYEATAYIVQMAQALHHAHTKGIVHRDVKPSNMLIDAENAKHLLLTDFGIAKLQGARGLTKTGTTIGTPEYMAPEQAEGKDIDARADVYSLGCVLYEALAGRPPFIGSSPVSVLYQQVHSRPPYVRGFNPDVPRELTRILDMALAKRPEDRHGTAEQLAQALAPFTEETGAGAPGASYFGPGARSSGQLRLDPPGPPPAPTAKTDEGRVPPLGESAGPVPEAAEQWRGLGAEGLDALFPDDPESERRKAAAQAAPPPVPPGTLPPAEQPADEGRLHHTIPLPAFRLPARRTRPLDLPLTSSGELDLERLMTQVDSPTLGRVRPQPPQPEWQPPSADGWGGSTYGQDPYLEQQQEWYQPDGLPPAQPGQPAPAPLRDAMLRTSEAKSLRPVWRPTSEEMAAVAAPTTGRRQGHTRKPADHSQRPGLRARRAPVWAGVGVVAVLLLLAASWVGLSASGLGVTLLGARQATATKAAPTATVTVAPTATATVTPSATGTATVNPQRALNSQAAAQFRAVTLATFVDGGCSSGNSTSHFSSGQTVYVNLCVASGAKSLPMTVQIRRGGTLLYTVVRNQYLAPGSSYWYSHYGLGAGTYDMLVTVQINGLTGTARDLQFTVG
jgi:serine/threonine-protein kinase